MSSRLQWAAVWGFCFLISIIIQQSVLRALHILRPTDYVGFSSYFFLFSIVMLIFFLTFIFHIRGYADLLPNMPSFISRVCSGFGPCWGGLQTRSV
jgi:hypothetical protein